jgi:CHAT domain-containing protein
VTRGKIWDELPGTRIEIAGLGKLFADDQVTLLADSDASEQRLVLLRESGELARFRYLHLATHGQVNRASNFESALILAQDHLSTADDVAAGAAFYDGRLTANEILKQWKLNAELVTLSSCESGLGREGGGEGFLGFAQALLLAGSRSVCLSLWEVDDTATALLMDRFYQNLLGKRAGLESPLPKAEALAEAKRWLRSLTVKQAAELAASLSHGVARGAGHKTTVVKLPPPTAPDPAAHPYEHPYYWAAFVLIGDAE